MHPPRIAVMRVHIDCAATWRKLLKRRWRRLRFGYFRWPYTASLTLTSGFDFLHAISYYCFIDLQYTVLSSGAWDREIERMTANRSIV